ncbi:30S ribosomal protein S2 [Candidatus Parcubacteria bacterium]|nr:30S ribosomal protein S2 [Candidatus Parcubacteria bacterium]
MSRIPTIEQMLKAGMHFGHKTSKWYPKMDPYIFGARNGIHIIDLVKSRKMLAEAMQFIEKLISEDKVILFVGTKMQAKHTIQGIAKEIKMPYITEKWMGGCLTNFLIIKKMITKYKNLIDNKRLGKFNKYTKKEKLDIDRTINKLELKVGGLVGMPKLPDALFVWDIKKETTAVTEAKIKGIPIIAVCDTNVNPINIDYVIPSNDDATKTVKLVLNLLKDTIQETQKKK